MALYGNIMKWDDEKQKCNATIKKYCKLDWKVEKKNIIFYIIKCY